MASANKVLVVDDEISLVHLCQLILEDAGYEVRGAISGKEALRLIHEEVPDLVLLDVMMPGMDGIELCRVLRGRPDTAALPILILSARGDAKSVMSGMDAGASDYLPKPILHHDLVAKVRRMLDMGEADADLRASP